VLADLSIDCSEPGDAGFILYKEIKHFIAQKVARQELSSTRSSLKIDKIRGRALASTF
jgi:hypothetical protein